MSDELAKCGCAECARATLIVMATQNTERAHLSLVWRCATAVCGGCARRCWGRQPCIHCTHLGDAWNGCYKRLDIFLHHNRPEIFRRHAHLVVWVDVDRDRRTQRAVVDDVGIGDRADHRDRQVESFGQQRFEVDHIRVAVCVNLCVAAPGSRRGRTARGVTGGIQKTGDA